MSPFARLALLLVAALLALPSSSLAQRHRRRRHARREPPAATAPALAPEVAALTARLDALRRRRPPSVPEGTLESVAYLLDVSTRIARRFPEQSAAWRAQAARFLARAESGHDPYPEQRGRIVNRGYVSALSTARQGYAVYLPPGYDPSRAYPLMVVLHGGSSNGNLFLGVVLGNNVAWREYEQHFWDEFAPSWRPDWIVVAPDGFGQVMWRWMGEADALAVLDDVARHYRVDPDRVVLGGLSNGGVGAHNLGLRHAWRFSTVMAMAGAPSWLDYDRSGRRPDEVLAMAAQSGRQLADNAFDTDYRVYHGRNDPGPMRPAYIERYERELRARRVPARVTWYDLGHDVLYAAHRGGRIYADLARRARDPRPREVRVATGDYRASRQHWVTVTRLARLPEVGTVRAAIDGPTLTVETRGVTELTLDLAASPLPDRGDVRVVVDGAELHRGPRAALGPSLTVSRDGARWRTGPLRDGGALVKRPGSSGPLTDAYFGRMVHVYGTANPAHAARLRASARRGARGWPLWLTGFRQEVVADRDVTPELMASAHLVLYGTPGDNTVLDRVAARLPIRVDGDAVVAGAHRYEGRDVGARFIHPNPLAPARYVVVQTGTTPAAVDRGHNLPDFLPDSVVYDARTARRRPRLVGGRRGALAAGYFDDHWRLPTPAASAAPPPAPSAFLAPASDPAGRAAREIARRVPRFHNYRAAIAHGAWRADPGAVWHVRAERECLDALRATAVPHRPVAPRPTPVPTPVALAGPVGGVRFRSIRGADVVVACELAARLPALAAVLARHGVVAVDVASDYRDHPFPSFHTFGMALDLSRFHTRSGALTVLDDYALAADRPTCAPPPPAPPPTSPPTSPRARALRSLACDLAATGRFASVLTPDYNAGHRDHFHLDVRPDDPRLFVR